MSSFFRKLGWLASRRSKEKELREELEFHIEEEAEEQQAAGLTTDHAKSAALRELGNMTLLREHTRAMWGWITFEQLLQDLRYAFRTLRNNKVFSGLAIVSLALGIGANTAIFSFMDSILLRSLPVSDPQSLVTLNWRSKQGPSPSKAMGSISPMHAMSGSTYSEGSGIIAPIFPYPAFELMRKNESVFSDVVAFCSANILNVTVRGQSDIAAGEYVSGDFFRTLGVSPAAGRLIFGDDDRAGAPATAVISFSYSQKRFGGAANAAGESVLVNNIPFTVVGVAPPEFFGVDPITVPDLYLPMHGSLQLDAARVGPNGRLEGKYLDQNYYWVEMIARLRRGVSMQQAQARLAPPFHNWVDSTAATNAERANLPELVIQEGGGGLDALRRRFSQPLYVLMTLVGLILAIACANIANLLLARSAARRREMALRLSVGAGRARIVRQLLTESVLLASIGGILGVLVAIWGMRFLTLLLAAGQPNLTLRADLNWHVLGLAAGLSVLTGILFGLAPAIQSTRVDVTPALKEIRAEERRSRFRVSLSQLLIAAQIALSLLILVAAGLFVRTLSNLQSINLGFSRENLLLFQLNARQVGHRDPEIASFYSDLQKRFSAIPGVHAVSLSHFPLFVAGTGLPISVSGVETINTRILYVGPGFFATMEIPVLQGRDIEERDGPGAPPIAVINESFAKANFGDRNPLGQHITLGDGKAVAADMEIAGVTKDARYGGLKRDIPPVVYMPYHLRPSGYALSQMFFVLRTGGDPLAYINTIRQIVHQADPLLPVTNVTTQAALIDQSINQEIVFARLCTAFGVLALVIACVGLYGTMSYKIARRTGEIGIRMALGARRGGVIWMVLREVLILAAVGFAIGLPVAVAASKLVESFLFGMKPNDPLALTLAAAILLAAAIAAGYAPARRASRIDPMVALRHE